MAIELRLKEFSALPVADDGKTLLYADGEVKQSSKNLSEMLTDEFNNKLDTTAFSTVSGSFLTAHQVIPSGKWENASNVVIANSGIWGTETDWTEDINAASAYAYEQAVAQIPDPFDPTFLSGEIDKKLDKTFSSNFYPMTGNPSGFLTEHQDLSNYYTKLETSSKIELTDEFNTKQNIINNKKDSSIPYLETSGSDPSWETIETSTINAHGTAVEGELYDIPINGRTYKVVCLNGKLWLAENYVNEAKATYTHPKYGSYFNKSTINSVTFVPQGWHIPSKEEWQELIDYTENHEKYLSTTDWHQGTNYVQGTNELKLNILPGSEYNPGRQEISSEHYQARFWTSTDEILSQSTGKQRVYAKISNYVGYNSKIISFDWDGPGSLYYFPVRLIKDDLEVPAPDGWKKFNGRNFMAIADDEGNTFKDFYLKTSAAQQLYQPKGDYASSASVTVLNTYYGLTTTGWKDISTNYYDKQTIDSMITGGGDYVEHSEITCKIGTGNTGTSTAILIQGKNNLTLGQCALVQGENNIAGYYSFAQGTDNIAGKGTDYPNYAALAQGWANTAENYSLAQGYYCSATSTAFAQGDRCSAYNYSFAQGNKCYAYDGASFAQGQFASATNWGVAFGNQTSATNNSFVLGSQSKSINWSMAAGQTVSAYQTSFAQGQSVSASNYSLAQGSNVIATGYSIVQGQYCTAHLYSFAQGGWNCSAYNQSFAQGKDCSAKDQSLAQGENCTSLSYSFAQGKNNYASYSSFAQGGGNSAINGSVAVGIGNSASDYSFAGGSANTAKNYNFTYGVKNYLINNGYSIVVGSANSATGPGNNIVIGASNTADGGNNVGGFIFGRNNWTHNECAIALGSAVTASQERSVAIGTTCTASGIGTIAIGSGIIAWQQGQIAIGTYNNPEGPSAKFVVGIGSNNNRKNGLIVTDNSGISAGDFITSGGYKLSDISAVLELLNNKPASGQPYMIGLDANGNLTWLAV